MTYKKEPQRNTGKQGEISERWAGQNVIPTWQMSYAAERITAEGQQSWGNKREGGRNQM